MKSSQSVLSIRKPKLLSRRSTRLPSSSARGPVLSSRLQVPESSSHSQQSQPSHSSLELPSVQKNIKRIESLKSRAMASQVPKPHRVASSVDQELPESSYINSFFPYPSQSKYPNRVPVPGDWEFSSTAYNPQRLHDLRQELKLKVFSKIAEVPAVEQPPRSHFRKYCFAWKPVGHSGPVPASREETGCVSLGDKLWFVGGTLSHVHYFQPTSNRWSRVATEYYPSSKLGHSVVGFRNNLVVFGGWDCSGRKQSRKCSKRVYQLNTHSAVWQRLSCSGAVPTGRRNQAACAIGSHMFVFGGCNSSGQVLDGLYILDLDQLEWHKPALSSRLPRARSHCTLNAVEAASSKVTTLVLFGGIDSIGQALSDCWLFQREQGIFTWTQVVCEEPPLPRYAHAAASVSGLLFIFGGRNDHEQNQDMAPRLDILAVDQLKWLQVPILGQEPTIRWGHCCQAFGSKVFVFGGLSSHRFLGSELYALETDPTIVRESDKVLL